MTKTDGAPLPDDDGNVISTLLADSVDPEVDSYACLLLPPRRHAPSAIRRQFLSLSRRIHPDRHQGAGPGRIAEATAAFQKLAAAFEVLYERESQERHLAALDLRRWQPNEGERKGCNDGGGKRPAGNDNEDKRTRKRRQTQWKKRAQEKRRKKASFWSERRSWCDVVEEMRRRERLEREFIQTKSDARMEKRVRGMVWRAMRICRSLDEAAGCPASFVNGLWAPLYEAEVLQEHRGRLPEGWEVRECHPTTDAAASDAGRPPPRVYRHVPTGEEKHDHPDPEVQRLLEKARAAEQTNKCRFHSDSRKFLGEIIEYLREDHKYHDMDDDLTELEEEERAKNDGGADGKQQQQAYDY